MRPPEPDSLPPPCGRHKWMAPYRLLSPTRHYELIRHTFLLDVLLGTVLL